MSFQTANAAFKKILGSDPRLEICLENYAYPFAHEAGVFIPETCEVFMTSNRIQGADGEQRVQISKFYVTDLACAQEEINPEVLMANGGVEYKDGIIFCSQGTLTHPSKLVYMKYSPPFETATLVEGFGGRQFNSVNDVVIYSDGSIWFTDPSYGYEQGFRPPPQLPNQVYRFNPQTKSLRVMADGFGKPNGIAFSPDCRIVYITDTDSVRGDGTTDLFRPSTIYAFDVTLREGEPFLVNRRVFSMADVGVPDGIKCDMDGNVYSGCGDGIHVWSGGGVLLGKILVPGGVSNFCFARPGEIIALNEHRVWKIALASSCRGSVLKL